MLFIFLDCFCVSFRVLKVSVFGMFAFSQMARHAEGLQKTHLKKPAISNFQEMNKTQFHTGTFLFLPNYTKEGNMHLLIDERCHDYYNILEKADISTADIPKTLQLTPKRFAGMNDTNVKK